MTNQHLKSYGNWAGKPEGFKPNLRKCAAEIFDKYTHHSRQCSFKSGHGTENAYCKIHASKL